MTLFDPVRYSAFIALLEQPDPADLPARRHVWTCDGAPDRLERYLPRIVMAWIQQRIVGQELDAQAGQAKKAKRRRQQKETAHVLAMRERNTSHG